MNRKQFRASFNVEGLVVLPVIHVLDNEQAVRNIRLAKEGGCPGVFLINHDFPYDRFLPVIEHARKSFPDYWIGVNFLAVTGKEAFPVLAKLGNDGTRVDAYWADDARIDESSSATQQDEAVEIDRTRKECGWKGSYFGGTAFKKQREVAVENYAQSATIATDYMDIVTTSGIATGHSADLTKIETFREACGDTPLALASGITPENIADYLPFVDAVLVATGINKSDDFYNIDAERLARLMQLSNPI